MPVSTQPKRSRQTQGIALVVVLLSAMVLMVSLLAISATMTISSQRTTADQGVTLQAQYAAEAGLARATAMQTEIQNLMQQISIPTGQSSNTINAHVRNFCGGTFNSSLSNSDDGPVLCTIATPTPNFSNRYSLFTEPNYLPISAYPSGVSDRNLYWRNAFGGSAPTTLESKVSQNGTAESWYKVTFGLQPKRVVQRAADNYRLFFTANNAISVGEVRVGGQAIASRQLRQTIRPNSNQTTSGEYYIDVYNPSFSRYVQFRDHTKQTSKDGNGQLYFGAGEQFDGPVHTNETPGFIGSSTTNPLFTDEFTTAAKETEVKYSGLSKADYGRMFPNTTPRFNTGEVDITENRFSQLRAAMGGDEDDTSTITNSELRSTWGIGKNSERNNVVPDGVYFSKGNNNNKANNENSWVGDSTKPSGIYVKGKVDLLKFSKTNNTASGRQVIEITQAGVVTRFEQQSNGNWTVKEGSNATRTLSGSFNGMIYIDGDVASLGGDGSDTAADIAADSQVTLASTGNVIVKDSITYTDNPLEAGKENAKNVLGIYTNGARCGLAGAIASCGSVELDGTASKDLTLHATIMASRDGQGFGTLNCGGEGCPNKGTVYDSDLGANRQVRINVLGGVVESQSQTVSSGNNGYRRNYDYDRRFKSGFTPPFFPKRSNWQADLTPFNNQQQVWQQVGN